MQLTEAGLKGVSDYGENTVLHGFGKLGLKRMERFDKKRITDLQFLLGSYQMIKNSTNRESLVFYFSVFLITTTVTLKVINAKLKMKYTPRYRKRRKGENVVKGNLEGKTRRP